mmetsp:Transcript_44951/g.83861  ORF Transcript_44951/g.83861 Transcript_44951/m.83861 type:complete len:282 (-) Transcript_44951:228-1073(-)
MDADDAGRSAPPQVRSAQDQKWIERGKYMADMLEWTSRSLGNGIVESALIVESGIQTGSKQFVANTSPAEHHAEVSEETLQRLQRARNTTSEGTAIALDLRQGVLEVTDHVASQVADVMTQATTAHNRAHGASSREPSNPKLEAFKTVALASVSAFDEVYKSVITAGTTVAQSSAAATTEMVGHKFGDKAAQATSDGLNSFGNVAQSAIALLSIGPRSIARRAAKSSAKECLKEKKPDGRFAWVFEELDSDGRGANDATSAHPLADADTENSREIPSVSLL